MKEREVGEYIVLEVVKDSSGNCNKCFFHSNMGCGVDTKYILPCSRHFREDKTNVYYKEILKCKK